jgi:hypothetical protein
VRVEGGKVEFSGDEEEGGAHGGQAGVAPGFACRGVEEPVDGNDTSILRIRF